MRKPFHLSARRRRALLVTCLTIAASQLIFIDVASAQQLGQAFAPLQAIFQAVVDFITGPFGRLCAIIAVMSMGFLAWVGRLSWFVAGGVAMGIGLVFGGPSIVDALIAVVGSR